MRDSNPRMVGPEPTALPLGESPMCFLLYHISSSPVTLRNSPGPLQQKIGSLILSLNTT